MKPLFYTCSLLLIIGYLIYSIMRAPKKELPFKLSTPKEIFYLSKLHNADNLQDKKNNILIIYFNPDCEYCKEEIIDIERSIRLFKNCLLKFVSSADSIASRNVLVNSKLLSQPNVCFYFDAKSEIKTDLQLFSTPSIFLFKPFSNQVYRFTGITDLADLEPLL